MGQVVFHKWEMSIWTTASHGWVFSTSGTGAHQNERKRKSGMFAGCIQL